MEEVGQFLKRYWYFLLIILLIVGLAIFTLRLLNSDDANNLVESEELAPFQQEPPQITAVKEDNSKRIDAFLRADIVAHNTRENCWLMFGREIYDVSEWEYPGETDISPLCGQFEGAKEHFEKDNFNNLKAPAKYFIGFVIPDTF